MKQVIYILAIACILVGCKEEVKKTSYKIDGNAKDIYNGIRVYLNEVDDRGRLTPKDTAIVMNEKFTFDGSVEHPRFYNITINGTSGRLPIMLENGDLKLNIDKKTLANSKLEGSESHAVFKTYSDKMMAYQKNLKTAQVNLRNAQFKKDSVKLAKIQKTYTELNKEISEFPYNYIAENSNNYGVLPIFKMQLNARGADLDKMVKIYDGLDENIKTSLEAAPIKQRIDMMKAKLEADKATAIGVVAPKFSASNPKGEQIALDDVLKKGKITIIDFWAAWCGPCRRENPNVVKIYDKYHDKGLEIIGVGLDGRRGQQNPKDAWIKAIDQDKLTWHQVSNLKYFDEIAKAYNVNSIPAMFILDNNGKILAKNLRGRALENKIAQLLN